MKQLLVELTAGFDELPPQLKEAARWVIDHPADVALLTMREQARRAGIPPATLTRLAQRFKLQGYDEIRGLFAEAFRQRPESYRGRAAELLRRRDSEGDEALIQDIFSSLSLHLQELSTPPAIDRLRAAAEIIAKSKRVFCLGLRSTFSVAYGFHYARSLLGAASVLVDGPGGIATDALRTIGPADVLLAISVKPYTRQTVQAARYADKRGARIIAITDSEVSPLAMLSRQTLVVGTETPSFFHTMTPAFAAIECLTALVAARRGTQTIKSLAASEQQLEAFDTYLPATRKRPNRS
ncbi:MAG: MurR/RpiR family transcriptional regulator [Bradyrhizobium sp.]|uniref:MurR/RpiR family transcriptional regulator n=1 Tax=Bradyrhizobium sp. TaxID=376 RepID=UPI001208C047|nr:MurR/RpiR family transcriptional regulator [Bradyrhizobium sp.]THD72503.1 MAG: MurR/RpiR family transcriptional regulator [Bradyrhizobium sp.]